MDAINLSNSHQRMLPKALDSVNCKAEKNKITYNIAHATYGRIRFCITKIARDSDYADKLKAIIEESNSAITDVRINQKAASIAITYKPDAISDDEMRSHLIKLIQVAPNIEQQPKATARPLIGAIFDAVINFIGSIQNLNKVRTGIQYGRFKSDFWENLLSKAKGTIKKLKSAVMFLLPKRSQKNVTGNY